MEILAAYELNSNACLNIVFELKQQVSRFYSCIFFSFFFFLNRVRRPRCKNACFSCYTERSAFCSLLSDHRSFSVTNEGNNAHVHSQSRKSVPLVPVGWCHPREGCSWTSWLAKSPCGHTICVCSCSPSLCQESELLK